MKIYKLGQSNWVKVAERDERSWVHIEVPKSIMNLTQSLRDLIDPDDLYEEKGNDHYGLETEPHITVKWGLYTDDADEVRETIDCCKAGEVELGETSLFEKEDYDVLKITCESKGLSKMNKQLGSLENDDSHPKYNAHITLAYLLPGKGPKYAGRTEFVGKSFKYNEVIFEDTKNKETIIKLDNINKKAGMLGDGFRKWDSYVNSSMIREALKALNFYNLVGPRGTPMNEDHVQAVVNKLRSNGITEEEIRSVLKGPNGYVMI